MEELITVGKYEAYMYDTTDIPVVASRIRLIRYMHNGWNVHTPTLLF